MPRVNFFLRMAAKQRALAENATTFTFTEFADGIKWHRTVDTFCCSYKPEGPGQDGKGVDCQKPHKIHQEQMPVLPLGMTWSGTLPPEGQLGREGPEGMMLDSRLGISQQWPGSKTPRAARAGLAWWGGAEEWLLPSPHGSLGCQFCEPLLKKDPGYLEYAQQEATKLLEECSWFSLEKSWIWGNLTVTNLAEGKME